MEEDLQAELMALFLEEGAGLLAELSALMDAMAASPEADEPRKTALRVAHNFAGIAGSTGFLSAMRLGQALDAMLRVRITAEQLTLARQATGLLLQSLGKHGHEAAHDALAQTLAPSPRGGEGFP